MEGRTDRASFTGFGGFTGFGSMAGDFTSQSRRRSKRRCGFTSRANAASLTASTSSMLRQRLLNLNTLTRRHAGEVA